MTQEERIEKAIELSEKGDQAGVERLIQSKEDLELFEATLSELSGPQESILESVADSKLGAAAIGFADKVSFEFSDELYGALNALANPNDPRPFEVKYREAQRAFAQASEKAWENHPYAYSAGALPGVIANAAASAPLGMAKGAGMLAAGALTGAGAAKEGEVLAGAATGAASVPVATGAMKLASKTVVPLAQKAGEVFNKYTGEAVPSAYNYAKNVVLGADEATRTKFREYGSKIRNLGDVSKRREELRLVADKKAAELENLLQSRVEATDDQIKSLIRTADTWYKQQGKKAISGKEVAVVVQKYIKRLEKHKDWISLNDAEKTKFLKVLRNLKDRVMFKSDKDLIRHGELRKMQEEAYSGAKSINWREAQYTGAEQRATEKTARAHGEIDLGVESEIEKIQRAHDLAAQGIEQRATEESAEILGKELHGVDLDNEIIRTLKELSGVSVKQMKADQEAALLEGTSKAFASRMNELDARTTGKTALEISKGEVAKDAAEQKIGNELESNLNKIDTEFGNKFAQEIGEGDVYGDKAEKLYRDLSLEDLNSIRAQLQEVTDAGSKVSLRPTSSGGLVGEIKSRDNTINNPRIQKIVKDMEVELRDVMDSRADQATTTLGMGDTWKSLRTDQHRNLILKEKVPNVSDMKALADEGSLSTKSAELATLMDEAPISQTHADLQAAWKDTMPIFQEYSELANLDPARKLSRSSELQFRYGSSAQGISEAWAKPMATAKPVASALARNYVLPRVASGANPLVSEIVKFVGDQAGIPGALASEEIVHAQETGDDASLEQYMGEVAPKLEGFFAPSPVMTSKGRARSAIVDRSGVRARIVDPAERNAIRDDVWKDNTMSIKEKSKKVDQLNKTEKIDLDLPDTGAVQTFSPSGEAVGPQYESKPIDVYGALNGM